MHHASFLPLYPHLCILCLFLCLPPPEQPWPILPLKHLGSTCADVLMYSCLLLRVSHWSSVSTAATSPKKGRKSLTSQQEFLPQPRRLWFCRRLFVIEQENAKMTQSISMSFCGGAGPDPRKKQLHFCADPDRGGGSRNFFPNRWLSTFLLISQRITQKNLGDWY